MKLQENENTALPLLKKQLAEVEKGLDNLITAMQMGMLTKSTKKRLDELEEQKECLEADILKEEIQQDVLKKDQVIIWLKNMKRLDLSIDDNKRMLVDTFVNAVHLYDDKVVISFNFRDRASKIALSYDCVSDCANFGEPQKARRCVICGLFHCCHQPLPECVFVKNKADFCSFSTNLKN